MFTRAKTQTRLDAAIDRAFNALENQEVTSEDYSTVLDRVATLHDIKQSEKPDRVSMDTVAVTVANLLGIVLILRHEDVNVITSRAMNLVMKPK